MPTGTMDISTLLATNFQSAKTFGLDRIQAILADDLDAHNTIVRDMLGSLVEFTTDLQRKYGTSVTGTMDEVDEYGRARTQTAKPGATVGFPLRLFQFAIGWTNKWFETHTPADMAIAVQNSQKAHLQRIQLEIKKAIMLSANYTFNDFLVDKVDLNIKRLVNADSMDIPDGPNGETYDGATHSHYNARAGGSLAAADVTDSLNDVVEHGHGGDVKVAINKTDETAFRALTTIFTAYPDPRVIFRNTDTLGKTLDITRLDNRAIGTIGGGELWVKPWVPANYAVVWDEMAPEKPLALRQRAAQALQGLRIVATLDAYPLHAQYMEDEFGIGVWNRTAAAVLYFGGSSYTDPTL